VRDAITRLIDQSQALDQPHDRWRIEQRGSAFVTRGHTLHSQRLYHVVRDAIGSNQDSDRPIGVRTM
jgi:hypothetical protein